LVGKHTAFGGTLDRGHHHRVYSARSTEARDISSDESADASSRNGPAVN
jgi:hypothetical protein